jgi:hypothetical protein
MEPLIDRSSTHIRILLGIGVRAKLSEKRKGVGSSRETARGRYFYLPNMTCNLRIIYD